MFKEYLRMCFISHYKSLDSIVSTLIKEILEMSLHKSLGKRTQGQIKLDSSMKERC